MRCVGGAPMHRAAQGMAEPWRADRAGLSAAAPGPPHAAALLLALLLAHSFAEAREKRPGQQLDYEFVDSPALGVQEWREARQYDAVTCMFAIHYFFVTEQALKQVGRGGARCCVVLAVCECVAQAGGVRGGHCCT